MKYCLAGDLNIGVMLPLFDRSDAKTIAAKKDESEVLDARLKEQMDDLYERALDGDMRAKELWFTRLDSMLPVQEFNVDINIIPYTIADKSLANIIAQADVDIVVSMLDGLGARLEADEAPKEMHQLLRCLKDQFREWGDMVYAPNSQ